MITAVLLGVAAAVIFLAPRVLVDRSWVYRSPVLGLTAWYAALFSVTSAMALATLSLAIPWPRTIEALCAVWSWCVDALSGEYGLLGHVAGGLTVGLALLAAARVVFVVVLAGRAVAGERRRHRDAVTMVGQHSPRLGVTVLEHTGAAAYLVPGRSRRIVVTSGALALLSEGELAAVVAHERAHASGRHHVLLDGARLLEQALPRIALFTTAREQIARLVEMRADEVAGVRHAPIDLARALVALATGSAAPAQGLAATGGNAVERMHRMLEPPAPLHRVARGGLLAAMTAVAMLPLAAAAVAWVEPVLAACLPL